MRGDENHQLKETWRRNHTWNWQDLDTSRKSWWQTPLCLPLVIITGMNGVEQCTVYVIRFLASWWTDVLSTLRGWTLKSESYVSWCIWHVCLSPSLYWPMIWASSYSKTFSVFFWRMISFWWILLLSALVQSKINPWKKFIFSDSVSLNFESWARA